MAKTYTLSITDITIDDFVQPRVQVTQSVVDSYADDIQNGCAFPPVVVFELDSGDYVLADGRHRLESHKKLGEEAIECVIKKGTKEDAFIFASTANRKHGLQLSKADRRSVIAKFCTLKDEWTDVKIAAHLQCTHQYVASVRKKDAPQTVGAKKKVVRNGKEYELDTKNIGKKKKTAPKKASEPKPEPEPEAESPAPKKTAKKKPAETVIRDGAGKKAPAELEAVFSQREKFIAFQDSVTDLIAQANDLFALPEKAGKKCNVQQIIKLLNDARLESRRGMPYKKCPDCEGKKCKRCKGYGWQTETEAKS